MHSCCLLLVSQAAAGAPLAVRLGQAALIADQRGSQGTPGFEAADLELQCHQRHLHKGILGLS